MIQSSYNNPVLADFRTYASDGRRSSWLAAHWTLSPEQWWEVTREMDSDEPEGTPEEIDHAYRVLKRLARIGGFR